jgi:hypothetical protein
MLARSYRWVVSELPFVLVIGLFVAAALYLSMFSGHWRRATLAMGADLLLAGLLRLTLPARRVGMLGVRSRWFDVVCYLVLGGVILGVDIRLH